MNPFPSNLLMTQQPMAAGSPSQDSRQESLSLSRIGSGCLRSGPESTELSGGGFEKSLQEALRWQVSAAEVPLSSSSRGERPAEVAEWTTGSEKRQEAVCSQAKEDGAEEASAGQEVPGGTVEEGAVIDLGMTGAIILEDNEVDVSPGAILEDLLSPEILGVEKVAGEMPAMEGAPGDETGWSPDRAEDVSRRETGGKAAAKEDPQMVVGKTGAFEEILEDNLGAAEAGPEEFPAVGGTEGDDAGDMVGTLETASGTEAAFGLKGEGPVTTPTPDGQAMAREVVQAQPAATGVIQEVVEAALGASTAAEPAFGLKGEGPVTTPAPDGQAMAREVVQAQPVETGVIQEVVEEVVEPKTATENSSRLKEEGPLFAPKVAHELAGPEGDTSGARGREGPSPASRAGEQDTAATGEEYAGQTGSETGRSNSDGAAANRNAARMTATAEGETETSQGTGFSRLQSAPEQEVLQEEGLRDSGYALDQGKGTGPARSESAASEPNATVAGGQSKGDATLRHMQGPPSVRMSREGLSNQVRLEIHEPDLGRMHWDLVMEEGRVLAKAMVDTARLQELLQNSQNVLQSGLREAGLEMDGFDVWVGSGSRGFSSSPEEKSSGPKAAASERGPDTTVSQTEKVGGNPSSSHGLDLFA